MTTTRCSTTPTARTPLRSSSLVALVAAASLLAQGCIIGRQYIGAQITIDPNEILVEGQTTMGEVLDIFGAPDVIQHRREGDIFIYRYLQKNSTQLRLVEPLIARMAFFQYLKQSVLGHAFP